jgi:hypothetical protein
MILQDYKEYKLEKKITILPRRGRETCEANLSHDLNFFQNKNDPQDNVCDAEQFTMMMMMRPCQEKLRFPRTMPTGVAFASLLHLFLIN